MKNHLKRLIVVLSLMPGTVFAYTCVGESIPCIANIINQTTTYQLHFMSSDTISGNVVAVPRNVEAMVTNQASTSMFNLISTDDQIPDGTTTINFSIFPTNLNSSVGTCTFSINVSSINNNQARIVSSTCLCQPAGFKANDSNDNDQADCSVLGSS